MEVSSGEKRPAEEGGGLEVREVKKAKGVVQSVKKVAEMVLVLAAMGKMRGARVPSEAERELMAEAREKLAELCEVFAPRDVFPGDAFGGLIEDLGLNKLKDQRLGFRPPKISIAEKLMLSRRKFHMEKSEEFTLPHATSSQRMQGTSGTAVESRGASHPVRVAPADKPSHVSFSSASPQPASALGQVAATNSTYLTYQLPTSEVRPIVSNALPSSNSVKVSTSMTSPRVDRPHFKVDGRQNGYSLSSQVQVPAHSSANQTTVKTPSWSVQPQSVSSTQTGSDNKVHVHASKGEGAANVMSGIPQQPAISKPLVTQIATGNLSTVHQNIQGVNFVQAPPVRNAHDEIGKVVQKFLQPRHCERIVWTPPSRDYMTKALTCQICQTAVTEVDTVLVCDNCEKGFHLKCLQTTNQKGALRGEWHCLRCLALSNGKPIPPKYGRVMRNIGTAKMSSNTVRPSPNIKAETVHEKVNQQKVTANGNTTMQSAPTGSAGNFSSHSMSDSKLANGTAIQGNGGLSGTGTMDGKVSSGPYPNNTSSTAHVTSAVSSCLEKLNKEKKQVDLKPISVANSATDCSISDQSQTPCEPLSKDQIGQPSSVELPSKNSIEDHLSDNELKGYEQGVVRVNPAEVAATTSGNTKSSSSNCYAVDWMGDVSQVVDENTYYQSCCINGAVYKVHDHVLVQFDNGKLVPSKLQAMWEDCKTRIKWVTVNRCYSPSDLPEAVGRPCGLESNEVYESTSGSTIMAGMIRGPCEVLPPNKFAAEKERRARVGMVEDDGSRPCYLCKWIYDESKGLFRDVSC